MAQGTRRIVRTRKKTLTRQLHTAVDGIYVWFIIRSSQNSSAGTGHTLNAALFPLEYLLRTKSQKDYVICFFSPQIVNQRWLNSRRGEADRDETCFGHVGSCSVSVVAHLKRLCHLNGRKGALEGNLDIC